MRRKSGRRIACAIRTASGRPIAPSSSKRLIVRSVGAFRMWWSIASTTPADSHAAIIARASSSVVAIGFSHSTCLPARAAATV